MFATAAPSSSSSPCGSSPPSVSLPGVVMVSMQDWVPFFSWGAKDLSSYWGWVTVDMEPNVSPNPNPKQCVLLAF